MICSSDATKLVAPINSAGDLARSLEEETAELDALLKLLRGERQALQARNTECVQAFAASKRERLARLSEFESARGEFLRANSLSQDHAGMQHYIERTPAHLTTLSESWRRLLANAVEARQINDVNGKLIAAQLHFIASALAALRQASSDLVYYSADGQTCGNPGPRTRAIA